LSVLTSYVYLVDTVGVILSVRPSSNLGFQLIRMISAKYTYIKYILHCPTATHTLYIQPYCY